MGEEEIRKEELGENLRRFASGKGREEERKAMQTKIKTKRTETQKAENGEGGAPPPFLVNPTHRKHASEFFLFFFFSFFSRRRHLF